MKPSSSHRFGSTAGFNLVEVSLAIAICAIGLITLLGLVPAGIDASKRACSDSLMTSFVSDLQHWRRITPYDSVPYMPSGASALSAGGRPLTTSMTLDAMGNTETNVSGEVNQFYSRPYYKILYTVMDHPAYPGVSDIARLIITVQWPCNPATGAVSSSNLTTRVFISDYARTQ